MTIVVFTAAIGETEPVRAPLVIHQGAEYLCFSDRPCPAPYEWIRVPPSSRPMWDARRIKILADHPRLQSADVTLWHDASYRLSRHLLWVTRGLAEADLVALRHARRTRIEDEALCIARYGYLTSDAALAHVARYRAAGFVDDVVSSGGLLGRRVSAEVEYFNRLWWDEAQHWNGRDQASLDYAAWASGLRVHHVPGTVRTNKYARWRMPVPAPEGAVA